MSKAFAVTRQALLELERTPYFDDLLTQGRVSDGPDTARERIRLQCGSVPDLFGNGCRKFELLRQRVSAPLEAAGLLDAVSLSAPHSHWGPCAIVCRWNAADYRYEIGPLRDLASSVDLLPVSFVFSDAALLPIEWCEACGDLGSTDYYCVLSILSDLNSEIRFLEAQLGVSSFGVSLNFRFKQLRERPLFPTIEAPQDDSTVATVSIDRRADYTDRASSSQVAWLLRRVRPLSDAKLEVLAFMSQQLASLEPGYARAVFKALISGSDEESRS